MENLQNGKQFASLEVDNEVLVEDYSTKEDFCLFEKAQVLYGDENYNEALVSIKQALQMNAKHEDELSLIYASDYQTLKGQIELHLNDYKNAYKSFESVANNPTCYDQLKKQMGEMMDAIDKILKNE